MQTLANANAAGCDSSATVVLTIKHSTSSSVDVTACETYTWNGVAHTTSGTYTNTLIANYVTDRTFIDLNYPTTSGTPMNNATNKNKV